MGVRAVAKPSTSREGANMKGRRCYICGESLEETVTDRCTELLIEQLSKADPGEVFLTLDAFCEAMKADIDTFAIETRRRDEAKGASSQCGYQPSINEFLAWRLMLLKGEQHHPSRNH